MILYKYLKANRLDVLAKQQIRFTQPIDLNDPFEMRPVLDRLFSKDFVNSILPEIFQNIDTFLSHIALRFKTLFYSEGSEDLLRMILRNTYFLFRYSQEGDGFHQLSWTDQENAVEEYIAALNGISGIEREPAFNQQMSMISKILESNPAFVPAIQLWVSYHMMQFSQDGSSLFMKSLKESMDDKIGILCLSEVLDNLLMWAHYTDCHSGFVIGFDSMNPFFDQKKSPTDPLRHIHTVNYVNQRPHLTLAETLYPSNIRDNSLKPFLDAFIYTKSSDWSYEREWRMVMNLEESDEVIGEGGNIYLYKLPPECYHSVILGSRCEDELALEVMKIVSDIPVLKHVKLYRASLDQDNYGLTIEAI